MGWGCKGDGDGSWGGDGSWKGDKGKKKGWSGAWKGTDKGWSGYGKGKAGDGDVYEGDEGFKENFDKGMMEFDKGGYFGKGNFGEAGKWKLGKDSSKCGKVEFGDFGKGGYRKDKGGKDKNGKGWFDSMSWQSIGKGDGIKGWKGGMGGEDSGMCDGKKGGKGDFGRVKEEADDEGKGAAPMPPQPPPPATVLPKPPPAAAQPPPPPPAAVSPVQQLANLLAGASSPASGNGGSDPDGPAPLPPPPLGTDQLSGSAVPLSAAELAKMPTGANAGIDPALVNQLTQAILLQAAAAAVPVAPPPAPPGLPPDVIEKLRLQMTQVEGTSGKICHFSRACKKLECPDSHPDGRSIEDDPESLVCKFGRKCKRGQCFYIHLAGRELDEDPSKGQCKLGKDCAKPECIFAHPEGRVSCIQLRCHNCGEVGHIAKDCPELVESRVCHKCGQTGHIARDCTFARKLPVGTYVTMSGFSEKWTSEGTDKLKELIAAELEVFGNLSSAPEVLEEGRRAIAAFSDAEKAREAVQELNGRVFTIEFCSAPVGADLSCEPGSAVTVSGFPLRWLATDVNTLVRGAIGRVNVMSLDLLPPEEDATTGKARVQFQTRADAKSASSDLREQKVAGKPLTICIDSIEDNDKDARVHERSRSRSRPRRRLALDNGKDDRIVVHSRPRQKDDVLLIHIDELDMPNRPEFPPAPLDCEVYIDPLPDEDDIQEWLTSFGPADDIFRIQDLGTGKPSHKGFVRFKDHDSAVKCVEAGTAKWSESERIITSQLQAKGGGRESAFPDSMVAKIVGPRGDTINSVKDEMGANVLILRGEGVGESEKIASQRVHFVCIGPRVTEDKAREVLEKRLVTIYEEMKKTPPRQKRSDREQNNKNRDGKGRRRRERSRSRSFRRDVPHSELPPPPHGHPGPYGYGPPPPGQPPHGYWPPPPGWHPQQGHPAPPPFMPADGHGYPPPAWMQPPDSGPPPGEWSRSSRPPPGSRSGSPPRESGALRALTNGDTDMPPGNFGAPLLREHSRPAPSCAPTAEARIELRSGSGDFWSSLPAELTASEQELAEAVVAFLRSWAETNDSGKSPNLIHIGADKRIRECKSRAVPPEVALRAWLERRLSHQVSVVREGKQATVQLGAAR